MTGTKQPKNGEMLDPDCSGFTNCSGFYIEAKRKELERLAARRKGQ
jgi:hypothetical protein